jgi:hypothetical protein
MYQENGGPDTAEWVNGSEARRLGNLTWGRLHRYAMLRQIAVQLIPGVAPRYRRSDVEALSPRRQAVPA